jgi:hypothetical protein
MQRLRTLSCLQCPTPTMSSLSHRVTERQCSYSACQRKSRTSRSAYRPSPLGRPSRSVRSPASKIAYCCVRRVHLHYDHKNLVCIFDLLKAVISARKPTIDRVYRLVLEMKQFRFKVLHLSCGRACCIFVRRARRTV